MSSTAVPKFSDVSRRGRITTCTEAVPNPEKHDISTRHSDILYILGVSKPNPLDISPGLLRKLCTSVCKPQKLEAFQFEVLCGSRLV